MQRLEFSDDGNTLVVVTQTGGLMVLMVSASLTLATNHELLGLMSSFTEVFLINYSTKQQGSVINTVHLPLAPTANSL